MPLTGSTTAATPIPIPARLARFAPISTMQLFDFLGNAVHKLALQARGGFGPGGKDAPGGGGHGKARRLVADIDPRHQHPALEHTVHHRRAALQAAILDGGNFHDEIGCDQLLDQPVHGGDAKPGLPREIRTRQHYRLGEVRPATAANC